MSWLLWFRIVWVVGFLLATSFSFAPSWADHHVQVCKDKYRDMYQTCRAQFEADSERCTYGEWSDEERACREEVRASEKYHACRDRVRAMEAQCEREELAKQKAEREAKEARAEACQRPIVTTQEATAANLVRVWMCEGKSSAISNIRTWNSRSDKPIATWYDRFDAAHRDAKLRYYEQGRSDYDHDIWLLGFILEVMYNEWPENNYVAGFAEKLLEAFEEQMK